MCKKCRQKTAVVLLACLIAVGCSCIGPPQHSVRIVLDIPGGALAGVSIGGVDYGDIAYGTPSVYHDVPAKEELDLRAGDMFMGTVRVAGWGVHQWTLTISGSMVSFSFGLLEDAP